MNIGSKSCCVVGCRNNKTKVKSTHFFRFPSYQPYRDLWISFSRRGSDYKVRKHSSICQDHFLPKCFVQKKKLVLLHDGSIPTIFYRETKDGIEKIELKFDPYVMNYIDAESLLNPAYDRDKIENELLEKQKMRKAEIKKSCRFCFESPNMEDGSFVEIKKLTPYAIKLDDVFTIIGLSTKYNKQFSNVMCEECFQQIILFDGFRKRCRKAQNHIIDELKDLEMEIHKFQGTKMDPESWHKPEISWTDNDTYSNDDEDDNDDPSSNFLSPFNSTLEPISQLDLESVTIKEEIKEDPMSDDGDDDNYQDHYDAPIEMDYSGKERYEIMPKTESIILPTTKSILITSQQKVESDNSDDEFFPSSSLNDENVKTGEAESSHPSSPGIEPDITTDDLKTVRSRGGNTKAFRIYECFFCRLKLAGKKLLQHHDCQVKTAICPVEGCGKSFTTMSGCNTHITYLHKIPKFSRLYCAICKLSMITTEPEFKQHRRMCEKTSDQTANKQSMTCEICDKICPNLQSFNIHKMFHKPTDTKKEKVKSKKGDIICDECAKGFTCLRYLNDHKKRVHREPEANPIIYSCDHCGKTRTNKYDLAKHIQNVHRFNPTPCTVCGKVFRNKRLVQAHMIYHNERKRIHYCPLCPNKPPWFTAVALKRHQESHHGFGPGYHCEACNTVYRTKGGLIQHRSTAHKNSRA